MIEGRIHLEMPWVQRKHGGREHTATRIVQNGPSSGISALNVALVFLIGHAHQFLNKYRNDGHTLSAE
jgi:hypothetical protein